MIRSAVLSLNFLIASTTLAGEILRTTYFAASSRCTNNGKSSCLGLIISTNLTISSVLKTKNLESLANGLS
ncbi:hypothetical protein A0H76_1034 [Hepatospora eriocheir]|uniref:Secreted protein n=1 Tax=Hepatospora eriocheir TaxID=1081669 RepID=A0A1X0QHR1_9MICR|nr:hypothetical protein A0H76_1034 [Hepatospora eriocheir]